MSDNRPPPNAELLAAFDAYARTLVQKPHPMEPKMWPQSWLFFEAGWNAGAGQLQVQLEAAQADAARYRWLRQQSWYDSPIACVMRPKEAVKLGHDCPSLERLDALIDELRK